MDTALRDALVAALLPQASHDSGGQIDVIVEREEDRTHSKLTVVRVLVGTGEHRLVIKQPREGGTPWSAGPDRPHRAPLPDARTRLRLEYRAHEAVQAAMSAANDPRLSAVVVRGYLEPFEALVMDLVAAPTLRDMLLRSALRLNDAVVEATSLAGRWLRAYQQIPLLPESTPRQTARDEVDDLVARHAAYLDLRALGLSSRVDSLRRAITERLPDRLETVLGHGDYAPRNIFVKPGPAVLSIDMWSQWAPPVYEDPAYFLVALRSGRPNLLSRGRYLGRGSARRIEGAFLDGYLDGAGASDRRSGIEVYAAVLWLDAWSAHRARVHRHRGRGVRSVVAGMEQRAMAAMFDRLVRGL